MEEGRRRTCRCCYITVDFATDVSQNWFITYKFSLHKKTNNSQKLQKKHKIVYYINLLSWSNRETRSLYDTFVELCKHCYVMQLLQNPPLCSSSTFRGRAMYSTSTTTYSTCQLRFRICEYLTKLEIYLGRRGKLLSHLAGGRGAEWRTAAFFFLEKN
jgi:hypothetical protein